MLLAYFVTYLIATQMSMICTSRLCLVYRLNTAFTSIFYLHIEKFLYLVPLVT